MNEKENKDMKNNIKDWGITILVFVVVFFSVRFIIGQAVMIKGESMSPTLVHGDRVFVEKISYIFSSPKKDDIIVFPYPKDTTKEYIKRVVGVPGDEIDFIDNNFYINGELFEDPFKEDYIATGSTEFPLVVGEKEYFVLGDNRIVSRDSRYEDVGLIHENDIDGRAFFVFYPFNRIRLVK